MPSTEHEHIQGIDEQLRAMVAKFVATHHLPGANVGIVVGDDLAWSFSHGFADVAELRQASSTDLYRIASITKTFTATAVMQLRDAGRLGLDDPVSIHLPELDVAGADPMLAQLTVRRLLSHESGLMGDPLGTIWSDRLCETDVHVALADPNRVRLRLPPHTQTKYSNLGFQLLGEVVVRCSGLPYGDYVRRNLLEPLGMTSTRFDPLDGDLAARQATGYALSRFSDELVPAEPMPSPHAPLAEGGLWSSVGDLARWVSAQFRTDSPEAGGQHVLRGSTLREMHRPRYLADSAWTAAFGIGWGARRVGERIWVEHSGGLPGFITCVSFEPRRRVGAIVLLNGVADAGELATALGGAALTALDAAVSLPSAPQPTPAAYRALLGRYHNDELAEPLTVEWRDGGLVLRLPDEPDWRASLLPTDDPHLFTVDVGIRESGEPALFEKTDDGNVSALLFASDRFVRLRPAVSVRPPA